MATGGNDLISSIGQNTMQETEHFEHKQEIMKFIVADPIITNSVTNSPALMENHSEILDSSTIDTKIHTIISWLKRPMQMAHADWSVTSPSLIGRYTDFSGSLCKPLFTIDFPAAFISGGEQHSTQIFDKLDGFKCFRGTLNVKVQVNSQATQWGELRAIAFPYPNNMKNASASHATHPIALSQMPSVRMDISQNKEMILQVPWTGPYTFYDIVAGYPQNVKIAVYPWTPLGDLAGKGKVEVVCWAWYDDIDVRFPTGSAPSDTPEGITPRRTAEYYSINKNIKMQMSSQEGKAVAAGKISGPLSKISQVASMASIIPGAGVYASAISTVAGVAGGIASAFGYSKIPNLQAQTIVNPLWSGRFMNVDGDRVTNSLALTSSNALDPFPNWSGSEEDELTIMNIGRHWSFLTYVNWDTTKGTNTILMSFPVSPMNFLKSGEKMITSPAGFACLHARLWRGTVRYTFIVTKTNSFHSGRLRILFDPNYTPDNKYNTLAKGNCISKVWDVTADSNTVTFDVPFITNKQWLRTHSGYNLTSTTLKDGAQSYHTGKIFVEVVTALVASEQVKTPIPICVYTSMGPDFELAVPITPGKYVPFQASTPSSYALEDSKLTTQMDKTPFRLTEPGDKMTNTEKAVQLSSTAAASTVGELLISLRQLLQRPIEIGTLEYGSVKQAYYYARFQPNYLTTASSSPKTQDISLDYIDAFSALFAYRRGGVRLDLQIVQNIFSTRIDGEISSSPSNSWTRIGCVNVTPIAENLVPQKSSLPLETLKYDGLYVYNDATLPIMDNIEGLCSVDVPYYAQYHCLINECRDAYDDALTKKQPYFDYLSVNDAILPENFITFQGEPTTSSLARIFRSAKTDFDFGYFLGVPLLIKTSRNEI